MRPVIIEEYNPRWKEEFSLIRKILAAHLQDQVVSIEHVGSTSVAGLAAKPILDIDIVIDSSDRLPAVTNILRDLGYIYEGDLGIPGRIAYRRENERVPHSPKQKTWMEQHVYVCAKDSRELERHLTFRDNLRQNPDLVHEYGDLKKKLAGICGTDRERYGMMKEEFIKRHS